MIQKYLVDNKLFKTYSDRRNKVWVRLSSFFTMREVSQGGKMSNLVQEAGSFWHAIIGRGITADPNKYRENTLQMVSQLR